jgi:hypothetical protein
MLRANNGKVALLVFGAFSAWVTIVLLSGLGFNLFQVRWDFSNTGLFGDSFGSLSAVMASLAAYSALATFHVTRQEIEDNREKEKKRSENEAKEKDLAENRRSVEFKRLQKAEFERTFFQLLSAFRSIVSETDTQGQSGTKTGRDAFKVIEGRFQDRAKLDIAHKVAWEKIARSYRNDLNHYFRFLYHTIQFVDSSDFIDRYFYVRLIRASLSDSELVLIALNCAHGEGFDKFKPLIEKYALLHNVSAGARNFYNLESLFLASSFDRASILTK